MPKKGYLHRICSFALGAALASAVLSLAGTTVDAKLPISFSMPPQVRCEGQCPGTVAAVITQAGQGGGVLIGEDLLLTVSHAISPNLRGKTGQAIPKVKFKVRFPRAIGPKGNRLRAQDVDAELVFATPLIPLPAGSTRSERPMRLETEWALLKLSKPVGKERGVARISSAPVTHDQPVTLWKTMFPRDGSSVSIRRETCRVNNGDRGVSEPQKGFMAESGCRFQQGNSGSPQFDEKGDLIGIVTAQVDHEAKPEANAGAEMPEEKPSRSVRINLETLL